MEIEQNGFVRTEKARGRKGMKEGKREQRMVCAREGDAKLSKRRRSR